MASTTRPNGRPEPEVIVNVSVCSASKENVCSMQRQFGDGFAYSKQRMDDAFRSGLFDKPPPKAAKEVHAVKKEDVELIVRLVL